MTQKKTATRKVKPVDNNRERKETEKNCANTALWLSTVVIGLQTLWHRRQ